MSDSDKIQCLRQALIGLLGQAEEYREEIGACDHAQGICQCRLQARIREAEAALAETKKT
jgi:hypothetical protein